MASGDFNGDGRIDLAVANFNDNTFSVLLGNGDGTFRSKHDFPAGNTPQSVVCGDFDGDGKTDVAIANYTDDRITVLLNSSAPGVGISPASHDFGSVTYNSSSTSQTFTLSNTGDALLTLTAMTVSGANAADFGVSPGATNPCPTLPAILPPGGSCTVSVTFAPTSAGARSASLGVASNAAGSPASVSLGGTGIATPSYPVNLTMNGTGGGSVTIGSLSQGPSVTCTTNCTVSFASEATVVMTGAPDGNSLVTWPDCTPLTSCYVQMGGPSFRLSGPMNHTATFTYVQPARIPGGGDYPTLQAAYGASADGGTILSRAFNFTEDMVCGQNISVNLTGGYDPSYASVIGVSTLGGSLTITNGTVNVQGVVLTP
jgi:hypothetical protein